MRVAHVITRLIVGGAQENTLLTAEDQHRDYGDHVTLLTGPPLGPEGSLLERALQAGFDVQVLPSLRRAIHPARDAIAMRALVRSLRSARPDIVHTHSSKAGILGRAAAAHLRIPAVHTIHGASFHYGQSRAAYRAYVLAERWAARHTERFISVADAMTDEYVRERIAPATKFTTVYSGFDVEPFLNPPRSREEVRRELGIAPGRLVIGKVARLFHLKGHEFLIAAAGHVAAARPDVLFLLVGDGILREQYESEIRARGLERQFLFTGLVPPEQIPELLHAMDIVVHTSQWEGLARVLPQALVAGKPVVTYDVGGAREVVVPGETGFVVQRDSVDELADAILRLAEDAVLRRRMGELGRSRCTEPFRHQTMTRRIREVYQQVLSGRMAERLAEAR